MRELVANNMEIIKSQKDICRKYSANYVESPINLKVGISLNVKSGQFPVHGLRHPMQGDTTGWYIWAGEYSTDPDFFKPLHVEHINEWNPIIAPYLGLAPGWRFLITPTYEDVWEDSTLLDI